MRLHAVPALSLLFLSMPLCFAKDKSKTILPEYVLRARTVLVIIDEHTGVSLTDPNANSTAQEDVEKALMKWGRLSPVMEPQSADLIISIRKGHGKIVEPTITGGPINRRSVILEPTDTGVRAGAQRGQPPGLQNDPSGTAQDSKPHPQTEIGLAEDTFTVYRGGSTEDPLDSPPVWRYSAKNALRSPDVPAVDAFRKLIAEAEKPKKSTP